MKLGKACGSDGLASKHFIYAGKSLHVLLAKPFSIVLSHGTLPRVFMETIIIPLVINKAGNTSDPNNYRPIALVSACSKIFESVLLRIIDDYVSTHDNQFGFKKRHSTDMCIYALKCTIEYYRCHNSSVYSCYLDSSKAYDKVNHSEIIQQIN